MAAHRASTIIHLAILVTLYQTKRKAPRRFLLGHLKNSYLDHFTNDCDCGLFVSIHRLLAGATAQPSLSNVNRSRQKTLLSPRFHRAHQEVN